MGVFALGLPWLIQIRISYWRQHPCTWLFSPDPDFLFRCALPDTLAVNSSIFCDSSDLQMVFSWYFGSILIALHQWLLSDLQYKQNFTMSLLIKISFISNNWSQYFMYCTYCKYHTYCTNGSNNCQTLENTEKQACFSRSRVAACLLLIAVPCDGALARFGAGSCRLRHWQDCWGHCRGSWLVEK